jgi:acyl-CoA reductase-like NAD-dependent aldehyde dehydrogenase
VSAEYRESLFIDGKRQGSRSGARVDVISPSTEEVFAQADDASPEDIEAAVVAAKRTFLSAEWNALGLDGRSEIISGACDLLEKRVEEIAEIQAHEMGAPLRFVTLTAKTSIGVVRRLIDLAHAAPTEDKRDAMWRAVVRYEPVGVVGTIAPWNGPFAMTIMKSTGALLAGNTVVDKPAIETPFDAMIWAEALAEAGLPNGAYNLVPGGVVAGEYLVKHRDVAMVSFTGGTMAGKAIASSCGGDLKPCVLELGGKSPAIVLPDADVDTVANAVSGSLFPNAGQVCSGFSRVLVPSSLAEAVTEALVERANATVVGDPLDMATTMGPLGSKRQYEKVLASIETGKNEGAILRAGGGRPEGLDRGYYIEPTVFSGCTNNMTIARDEIFGPVVTVLEYDGIDQAISISNDSDFGLHAGVFTADLDAAMDIAAKLHTGSVTFNGFTTNFESPRDGVKDSGLGVRFGLEGFEEMRYVKTINVEPATTAYDPAALLSD